MSKIALTPNVSGSGVFTIASPNSNTDRTLTLPDEAGTIDTLQRAGNVLQVVSATKTDTASGTNTSLVDVPGLAASITPTSASSKILVIANITGGGNANASHLRLALVRNSTQIAMGDAAGSRIRLSGWIFNSDIYEIGSSVTTHLDSPNTTSAVTYKVQASCESQSYYINRSSGDADNTISGRTVSSITVMEIAA